MPNPRRIGMIGIGAWGRNLLRQFMVSPRAEVAVACDLIPDARARAEAAYPGLKTSAKVEDAITGDTDAVVIATPPADHFTLAKAALEAGKDVFVEKPLVLSVAHGAELLRIARDRKRILMVGHIMVYHPAVLWLKDYIAAGELGEVHYMYAARINLGKVREIENAMWSFAPHDISMMMFLLDDRPARVVATGQSYIRDGIDDVNFLTLHFSGKRMGHIHASWLDPHKARGLTVVGRKKMVTFADTEPSNKITVYDKGVDINQDYTNYAEYLSLRTGDIRLPQIPGGEPLRAEIDHFLDRLEDRKPPRSDGADGLRVLTVLDAATRSLEAGGTPVDIDYPEEALS